MFPIPDLASLRTPEEMATAIQTMKDRLIEIDTEAGVQPLDDDTRAEFAAVDEAITAFEAAKTEFDARRARVSSLAQKPANREEHRSAGPQIIRSRIPDNLFDLSAYRSATSSQEGMLALMRDGALKASEQAFYPHSLATPERSVGHIHKLLSLPMPEKAIENGFDPGLFARHLLATGSPVYQRAFAKVLADLPMTTEERAAIATVGTTTTGGYAVPYQLDPTILLTSDGSVNPLRQISRVEQINVGNTWKGVTSAGVTASYGTEAVAVTDGSPTLGQPEVTVRKAKALIKFSIESGEDWSGLQTAMARLLQDAKDTLEADKFVNGTGSNEPEGVLYGIAATYNVGTTGDGFDTEDLGVITTRLPDRWEPRARWLAHRAMYTEAERLDRAAGGGSIYRPLAAGEPATLLGYPRHNSSEMESDFTTATNRIGIFGDFNQFLIADKVGLTVELIPHMVNGDGNPTGERGLFAYWRNSSKVLIDSAFRVLTVGVVTS